MSEKFDEIELTQKSNMFTSQETKEQFFNKLFIFKFQQDQSNGQPPPPATNLTTNVVLPPPAQFMPGYAPSYVPNQFSGMDSLGTSNAQSSEAGVKSEISRR